MGGTLIYWQIDYIWNGFNVLHQLPFEKNKGNFCNFFVNFNSYHSCKLTDDSTSFDPILLLLWLWLYFCFQIALLALSWPYLNDLTMNNHSDIGFCHFSLFMFFFFFFSINSETQLHCSVCLFVCLLHHGLFRGCTWRPALLWDLSWSTGNFSSTSCAPPASLHRMHCILCLQGCFSHFFLTPLSPSCHAACFTLS